MAHFDGQEPLQSTSVSVPFFTRSMHDAAAHTWLLQTPLTQLAPLEPHCLPVAHFDGQEPPQSTSVSVPFFTRSAHDAAWHLPLAQTRLTHWELWKQRPPVPTSWLDDRWLEMDEWIHARLTPAP